MAIPLFPLFSVGGDGGGSEAAAGVIGEGEEVIGGGSAVSASVALPLPLLVRSGGTEEEE